jgi:hypothetical protein
MLGESPGPVNMSGLKARLFPAALPFDDSLQRAPARPATKALQRTSPLVRESLVAPRPVARLLEKKVPE